MSGKHSGEMGVREVFGDFCGEISTNVSATRDFALESSNMYLV